VSLTIRRDRAKERRVDVNPDYVADQGVTNPEELRQLSIEESKFLGGDVEHTHLVKVGLYKFANPADP
jgi:hypothetical protein